MPSSALTRPARGKVVAGVCAGIARRFGWSPWLVRAVFLISCILPGPQILLYLLLWIVMPRDRF
jgi:phage shock protein PspC (stress-responsive transcriptional regulator)